MTDMKPEAPGAACCGEYDTCMKPCFPRGREAVLQDLQEGGLIPESVTALVEACYGASRRGGWWTDLATGEPKQRNKGEMLMLIVSEIAEAMEGERKDLMDDHLPHRRMAEVELADAIIRICDYAGGFGYDLGGAVVEKLAYNAKRADHKPENRAGANGKKF